MACHTAGVGNVVAARNEIVPAVTGERPQAVFVTLAGTPRKPDTIEVTLIKTVQRHLGVRLTPRMFRHTVAKIILDANPAPTNWGGKCWGTRI